MSDISYSLGLGGIFNTSAYTYEFMSQDHRLSPVLYLIRGRNFKYVFQRERVNQIFFYNKTEIKYQKHSMYPVVFDFLSKFFVYEYRNFAGETYGEVKSGYFVILRDCVKEVEKNDVLYWCGTDKDKERLKGTGRPYFAK